MGAIRQDGPFQHVLATDNADLAIVHLTRSTIEPR
jgi:hypothetical protein